MSHLFNGDQGTIWAICQGHPITPGLVCGATCSPPHHLSPPHQCFSCPNSRFDSSGSAAALHPSSSPPSWLPAFVSSSLWQCWAHLWATWVPRSLGKIGGTASRLESSWPRCQSPAWCPSSVYRCVWSPVAGSKCANVTPRFCRSFDVDGPHALQHRLDVVFEVDDQLDSVSVSHLG